MAKSLRLDFGNLPLVEAAVRATFADALELRFSSINEIHGKLKQSFPQLTELPQYEAAPGVSEEVTFGPGSIHGAVFLNDETALRATLQSRVVVVRWLQERLREEGPPYPRFQALKRRLEEVIHAVKEVYGATPPRVAVVNMSYVNFLRVADFSGILKQYFSPLMHVEATEGAEEVRKLEVSWRKDGVDLRFQLEKVTAAFGGESVEGYRLTTVAGMHVERDAKASESLERVHDRLQTFFHDAISDYAKKEWNLEVVDA